MRIERKVQGVATSTQREMANGRMHGRAKEGKNTTKTSFEIHGRSNLVGIATLSEQPRNECDIFLPRLSQETNNSGIRFGRQTGLTIQNYMRRQIPASRRAPYDER